MILHGDCIEEMAKLDEASIDAIVCDPPYGLEFMGKEWDSFKSLRGRGVGAQLHEGMEIGGFAGKGVPRHGKRWKQRRCRNCGHVDGGGSPCRCDEPDWEISTEPGSPVFANALQAWHQAWSTEAFRVLKPGGHLLAFGGTRTYHRLACAVEDAGFEIRDSLIWIYGSGFPKSLDVSKAIDKAAAEREVVGLADRKASLGSMGVLGASNEGEPPVLTAPATSEAAQWEGWGTALKPAHEPIVVARKPLSGTVAANVLEHGTGALNVGGCRVGSDSTRRPTGDHSFGKDSGWNAHSLANIEGGSDDGRWPANLALSPEAAEELDAQSGERPSAQPYQRNEDGESMFWRRPMGAEAVNGYGDTGGASRFFYTAKASRGERNAGLDGFEEQITDDGRNLPIDNPYLRGETTRSNTHPTVKPIDLMRWLCRLVTPLGGTILDPFLGSGTTGIAAHLEGFDFIGIEREAEYVAIAKARIEWWSQLPAGTQTEAALGLDSIERKVKESGQGSLLEQLKEEAR